MFPRHVEGLIESGTYTHGKGTAKVIQNDPGAGIATVIHVEIKLFLLNEGGKRSRLGGRSVSSWAQVCRWEVMSSSIA